MRTGWRVDTSSTRMNTGSVLFRATTQPQQQSRLPAASVPPDTVVVAMPYAPGATAPPDNAAGGTANVDRGALC